MGHLILRPFFGVFVKIGCEWQSILCILYELTELLFKGIHPALEKVISVINGIQLNCGAPLGQMGSNLVRRGQIISVTGKYALEAGQGA